MEALRLTLADLRQALARVLDAVEQEQGQVIEFDADYYWSVPDDVAYALTPPPSGALTVGQLSEDVDSVRSLLALAQDEYVPVGHELRHLVPILARLAAQEARR